MDSKKIIYLDAAATTVMYPEAVAEYGRYGGDIFFNPSSPYDTSLRAVRALNASRDKIAGILGAKKEEIIFTSSGTESDNLAVFGSPKKKSGRLLFGGLEHSAVYKSALELKNRGYDVEFVPVDKYGRVSVDRFCKSMSEDVVFASIMHVNNETGAVNDIKAMVAEAKKVSKKMLFHSDGVQAFLKIPVDVNDLGVDMYSVSAHKIHGPKGVGALYIKENVNINPIIFGGGQEYGLRSSTENVAGIAAFAKSAEILKNRFKELALHNERIIAYLRGALASGFEKDIIINTDFEAVAPHILNFTLKDIRGEVMVHSLEKYGILIGTGSACAFASKGGDRVAKQLKTPKAFELGFLRVSITDNIETEEIDFFVDKLKTEYTKLVKTKVK